MTLKYGDHQSVKLTDMFTLKVGNIFREKAFEKAKADPNRQVQGPIIVDDERKPGAPFLADVAHLTIGVDEKGRIFALHYG